MVGFWVALLPLAAAMAVPDGVRPACPAGDEIPYTLAARCIGETRRVAGHIDHVSRARSGITYVNFCSDWKGCPFAGIVFSEKAPAFGFLARLSGSEVVVSGTITAYQGHAQIVLTDPAQVTVRSSPPRPPSVVAVSSGDPLPVAPPARPAPVVVVIAPAVVASAPAPVAVPVAPAAPAPLEAIVVTRPPPAPVAAPDPPAEAVHAGVGDAGKYVGRRAHLRGAVGRLDFKGGELVVFFKRGMAEVPFVAVIAEPDVVRLHQAAEAWDGRNVEVEGELGLYDGRPGIFVREASQVRVLPPRAGR